MEREPDDPPTSAGASGEAEERGSPRRSRLRRLLLALVGLWVAYVVAFEIAARTGTLERWANRRPDKLALSFESAHSWFPFWGTASGLDVRGQIPSLRWRVRADRAGGWISPLPLLDRRVRAVTASARGIEVQIRTTAGAARVGGSEPGAIPPVEGELPPIPELVPSPATAGPPRPKWSFELPRVSATDVRDVWFDLARLTGSFSSAGSLEVRRNQELVIERITADLDAARLTFGVHEILSEMRGRVEASIAPWPFRERRKLEILPYVSTTAELEAHATGSSFLREVLPPWFRFQSDPAPLALRLLVRDGRFLPGSRFALEPTAVEAALFTFLVRGNAIAELAVEGESGSPKARLDLRFAEFTLNQESATEPEIVGTGLAVSVESRDLEIHGWPYEALAKVDFGDSRIVSIASYDPLVPASVPLDLLSGGGAVRGGLEVALPSLATRGTFAGRIEQAVVRYGELELHGTTTVDLALASPDLSTRAFELGGSKLALRDFRSPQAEAATAAGEPGWWAEIDVDEGRLVLPPEPAAQARWTIRLRDSVPIVGLFSTQRELPKWVQRALTVKNLEATGRLDWTPESVGLDDFATRFRKSTIFARMRFGQGRKAGAMMIEWWKLALGIRFDDDRKKLKLVGVRGWYAHQDLGSAAVETLDPELDVLSEESLALATYDGIAGGTVDLTEQLAASETESEEATAGSTHGGLTLVANSAVYGDLDGDGTRDAAVQLARDEGGAAPVVYLAAVSSVDGRPSNRATRALPSGSRARGARIEDGHLVLDLVTDPPAEQPESAPIETVAVWKLDGGTWVEVEPAAPVESAAPPPTTELEVAPESTTEPPRPNRRASWSRD